MNIQQLISKAMNSNFEQYMDCPHPDRIEHPHTNCLIMTCVKGEYDGEVIDVLWDYKTGEILSASVYSQFKGIDAKFKI